MNDTFADWQMALV